MEDSWLRQFWKISIRSRRRNGSMRFRRLKSMAARTREFRRQCGGGRGAPRPPLRAQSLTTAYCNTIPPDQEKSAGDRAIEHRLRSIIRWNAMAIILRANKDIVRARRPHRELPVGGHALRHRLRPLLACADRHARRRPAVHPGPQLARHLRARLPRRPADRGAAAELPPGDRRQGHLRPIRIPG